MARTSPTPRFAELPDASEVARLLNRFNVEFDAPTPGVEVLRHRVLAHLGSGASVFLLAEAPEVGIAQLRFREYLFSDGPICTLEELYVVPASRRKGHGRALLAETIEIARARRCDTVELNTSVADREARALYESMGFTNLERPGEPKSSMLFYERALDSGTATDAETGR